MSMLEGKKNIAVFDFDGTITNKDTLLYFILFTKGYWAFMVGFLLYSPLLIAFKLRSVSYTHLTLPTTSRV